MTVSGSVLLFLASVTVHGYGGEADCIDDLPFDASSPHCLLLRSAALYPSFVFMRACSQQEVDTAASALLVWLRLPLLLPLLLMPAFSRWSPQPLAGWQSC
jgi:hypothetical protein